LNGEFEQFLLEKVAEVLAEKLGTPKDANP